MTREQFDKLPAFISTRHLERLINRSPQYIQKRMDKGELPPRVKVTGRVLGWPKETIINWLKKHPEAINNG